MKKLILILALVLASVVASAQSPWKGFFKPVEKDLFTNPDVMKFRGVTDPAQGVWLFKFDVEITAVQLMYNRETKVWDSAPLSSAGPGIGYRHYVQYNGEPYCNFGVNALCLIGYDWTIDGSSVNPATLSLAGTVTFLDYVNVGAGYNFGTKAPMIIMGAIVKF